MKKALSLLLAALLVLTSVVALAEDVPSVTPEVTVAAEGATVAKADDDLTAITDALANSADPIADYFAPAVEDLKAIFGDAEITVYEVAMVTVTDVENVPVKVTFTFPTPFAVDQKVALVFQTTNEEFTTVEGTVVAEGQVEVELDAELLEKIAAAGDKVLVAVVAEK